MTNWVLRGLRAGRKTTGYPDRPEVGTGVSPGRPIETPLPDAEVADLVARCPVGAISPGDQVARINAGRCIDCFRCREGTTAMQWRSDYEWAFERPQEAVRRLNRAFGRSLQIRFLDAGACGACISEARQLNNPYYNLHRLGFFITPTPRTADVLLAAGPVSDAMRLPLRKTYEAMPGPKRVVAIGACALSGGVFGPSFAAGGGIGDVIPVDVAVPGCPPPPLAILHALLVVVGRKPPASGTIDGNVGEAPR